MSLLSGILNKIKKEVADKIGEAAANELLESVKPKPEKPESHEPVQVIPGGVASGTVIGGGGNAAPAAPEYEDDWYDVVPAEECQYNFNGPYLSYFDKIFAEDFPGYDISRECIEEWRRYKYTFRKAETTALVVELMTEKSAAQMLRKECLKNGVPYLRFYFDHQGWWNTRAYVKERVNKALGV
ncbi:MAG: hypothetical protein K6G56_07290 [Clostridiales bacterium]|nr:hypothetical protein [Clostridiales bacterium]